MNRLLARVGRDLIAFTSYLGGVTSLFTFSLLEGFRKPRPGDRLVRQVLVKQVYFTGVQGFRTITPIALVIGMLTIVQMFVVAPRLGAEDLVGKVLIAIIVRELGPLLTAIILIGRSGTAIATEIANMMVSDEFDALESIGVDPLHYIVYPRLAGMMVSLTALILYFNAVGLLGGYLVARLLGIPLPFGTFFNTLFASMSGIDILVVLLKGLLMGAAIASIAVMHGFKVGRSSTMVPVAATKAVVNSLVAVFLVDGLVSLVSYI